jgi:hypothetical protein
MKKTLALLGGIVMASSAFSAFVIDNEPGVLSGQENVLLNDTGLLSQGPVVQGLTEKTGLIVDFYGAGEDLFAGRARVMAMDGGFTQLSVEMNDPTLGMAAYRFNLDALGSGDVTIDVYDLGALVHTKTFSLEEQGPNWFRIYGTEGEAFSAVTLTSTIELAAIRNNQIYAVPNPVPEPAGILGLALGLASLAAFRKRQ